MRKEDVEEALRKYRIVAVVGLSRDPSKDSYRVAEYLKNHGFRIIPVNPFVNEVLGEKCYKSLLEMPTDLEKTVEVIDIFRPAAEMPSIVDQAVTLRQSYGVPYVVWMQLGIVNEQAAGTARDAGLIVIMNRCMMKEHQLMTKET
ncbi:hypothetical protein A3K79_05715 [Candidatus Bathyarchaeota archaeon RBG_13_46_16b]|nr:MAG: hypothetical protein A3K79_05715 [Candidatus Bathyarchaeota archaeon RBG_13_46_16b]